MTDAAVTSRADELIAAMTPAEKAGQLTQYFFLGFQRDADQAPGDGHVLASEPNAVETAMSRGEVGSLLFQTDPAEINRCLLYTSPSPRDRS